MRAYNTRHWLRGGELFGIGDLETVRRYYLGVDHNNLLPQLLRFKACATLDNNSHRR